MFRKWGVEGPRGETPIIFLSGKTESQTKVDALQLGAEDFLVKPVDLKELAARIRNVIRRDAKWRKAATGAAQAAGVVGDLRNLGVPDIVQTLHLGLKTACVRVTGKGGEGRIWFENGRIRHAEMGSLSGSWPSTRCCAGGRRRSSRARQSTKLRTSDGRDAVMMEGCVASTKRERKSRPDDYFHGNEERRSGIVHWPPSFLQCAAERIRGGSLLQSPGRPGRPRRGCPW